VLDVADDKSAGDLRSHDSWRNQPAGMMKLLKEFDAWQDVRRLGARVQLHLGIHNARAHRDRAEVRRLLVGCQCQGQHLNAGLGHAVDGFTDSAVCAAPEETLITRRGISASAKTRQNRFASATGASAAAISLAVSRPKVPTTSALAAFLTQAYRRRLALLQRLQRRPQHRVDARRLGQIELHEHIALARECRVAPTADTYDRETAFE
jgi:hypothetical protein